jgi:hypothetical protein
MSEQLRALLTQVLALPAHERIELLVALEVSLGPTEEADAALAVETRRRRDAVRAGTEEVLDWEEARRLIHRSRQ